MACPRPQVPALDGLRGLAILLVFVMHAATETAWGPLQQGTVVDNAVRAVAQAGWIGVDLFFVISGFLITGILLDTRAAEDRWRSFFTRRVLRIFPLYYGVLVFLFVILPRFWSDPQFTALQADQAWYWGYAVNLLPVIKHDQWLALHTQHFWSLAIEEQFYLVWPFVVWSCRPGVLWRVAAWAVVAGLVFRLWLAWVDPFDSTSAAYVLTPARLDGLMIGAALAVVARTTDGLSRLRAAAPWVARGGALFLIGIAVLRGGLHANDAVVRVVGYPVLALVFGGILVAALTRGRVTRWFEQPVLRALGKYSYGLYVFHLPIIGAFQWKGWLGGSTLAAAALFAAVTGVVSYGVAWLSYHVYEKHFLALKRHRVAAAGPALAPAARPAAPRAIEVSPGAVPTVGPRAAWPTLVP